jgi:hypothetical protein
MIFDEILNLSNSTEVKLSKDFANELDTELYLGMSSYVIKNGTLSDGFECLDDTARYYQSKKEMWNIGASIREQEVIAMEAQAELLDAEEELKEAKIKSDILRARARIMRAENRLASALVTVKDSMRQLKAFNEVREELAPIVKAKYKSIEEYEPERWKNILKYRIEKRRTGYYQENLVHVPLDPVEKARIGIEMNSPDATLYLKYKEKEALKHLAHDDIRELVDLIDEQKKIKLSLTKGE